MSDDEARRVEIDPDHYGKIAISLTADAGRNSYTETLRVTATEADTMVSLLAALLAPSTGNSETTVGRDTFILEIDWATDRDDNDIRGPIGPFQTRDEADAYGTSIIRNGEWNIGILHPVTRKGTADKTEGENA